MIIKSSIKIVYFKAERALIDESVWNRDLWTQAEGFQAIANFKKYLSILFVNSHAAGMDS